MSQPNPPDSEQQRSEIQMLRRRMMNILPDIDDQDLWLEISTWLYHTADGSHRGSLESQVRGELAQLTSDPDHKMHPHVNVDKPEDAFPDRCEDCEHYGELCPVLADRTGNRHLKRAYDLAESDDDLSSRLFEIASQYGCHVLEEIVSGRRENIERQKKTGHELYRRAIVYIKSDWNEDDATMPDEMFDDDESSLEEAAVAEAAAASAESGIQTEPPEEARETVDRISAAVDTRNQEEEEAD